MNRQLQDNTQNEHIYVNLRFDNIYSGNAEPIQASINKQMGTLIDHQNEYKMGVMFFNAKGNIPLFVCPIVEGFIPFGPITNITQAPIGVFTTATTTGLYAGLRVKITNILGMVQINGQYDIRQVLSPNTFTLNLPNTSTPLDTTNFSPYLSGGIIEKAQDNPNYTPYGVCYSYGGNDYPTRIIFSPMNSSPLPRPPSKNNGLQDLSNGYYYVYSYKPFLDLINNALLQSYQAFNTAHPGIHNSPIQYIYNSDTGLISMIAEYSYSLVGAADIYANSLLTFTYLEAINVYFNNYNSPNFKDCRMIIKPEPFNNNAYAEKGDIVPTPPTLPKYLIFTQEYDVRYLWNNIKAILFTSSTLQSRLEYMPNIQNINAFNATLLNINVFSPSTRNIVSYYDIITESGSPQQRQSLFYLPSFVKWIDLVTHNPLTSINIDIYFELTNGQIIPLYIEPNDAIDLKLVFMKKELNDM